MMRLMRVAGATINQTPMDWRGNEKRLRELLAEARARRVQILCLPELCISGYGCEDAFLSLHTTRMSEEVLAALLPDTRGIAVLFSLPHYYEGALYNCTALVADGAIVGINPKKVLPQEGIHYEPRWFRPWPFGKIGTTSVCGVEVPIGDISYQIGDVRVAVEICEEAWGDHTGAAVHARHGAEIVLAPSASHFALGKYEVRERLVANNSRAMAVHYVYTNLVGLEAGRAIFDGGVMIAECGKIVARGPRFGFKDWYLTATDVDVDLARVGKIRGRSLRNEEDEDIIARRGQGIRVRIKEPAKSASNDRLEHGRASGVVDALAVHISREDEFLNAEMLALFDYMRKTRSRGYVVSLSGGVDSATCALLVGHMIAEALRELGPKGLAERIRAEIPGRGKAAEDPRSWIRGILTCAYQRTANSGKATEGAAMAIAGEIGADFHVTDVQPMVEAYQREAERLLKTRLTWERHDMALQNIQARARAPLAWLVANARNAILLTTSNRSEGAVGYATMDGDTAGGLAPLSGIDKPFLRRWLVWAERSCDRGLGPVKALRLVNAVPPTAELRPKGMKQSDEDDLMPYVVLERIERLLVRDKAAPADILAVLRDEFSDIGERKLREYLERFLRLFAASQWKRERMAVGFHLDDESLDPKTWCRYPVLSGGYEKELDNLRGRSSYEGKKIPKKSGPVANKSKTRRSSFGKTRR